MNKKKYLFFSIFIIIILVFILIVYSNNYKKDIYIEKNNESVKNNNTNKIPGMVSLMIETKVGTGVYEPSTSTTWPTKGYEFKSEKSCCESCGKLSYN